MDWILSFTTVLVSCSLGWSKGNWKIWLLTAVNSGFWIFYAISIKQFGLIPSAGVSIILSVISAVREFRKVKNDKRN